MIAGDLQELLANKPDQSAVQHYAGLRDRMIALILRKTRLEQNLTNDEISTRCSLEPNELDQYESGNKPIPLPILELLCSEYQIPMLSLVPQKQEETTVPIENDSSSEFQESLPDGLSDFVNNPANLPYLELARKLSDLDAAKLRSIAEGLLEITY
jgi:transcriptional regulator with XRE-family HTH domain